MRKENIMYKECICAECGKNIIVSDGWVYKRKYKNKTCYYCSWSCFRADEIRKGIDRNGKKEKDKITD